MASERKPSGPPSASKADVAHSAVKAALSSLPYVGGAAGELLNYIVAPPLEKRRDEWFGSVEERLRELEAGGGVDIEALREDEGFIDVVVGATRVALTTSQEEKLRALRAAVTNTALGAAVDETERLVFLRLVDEFTAAHLQMLAMFHDPPTAIAATGSQLNVSMGGLSAVLKLVMPELAQQMDLARQIAADLGARGLTNGAEFGVTMSGDGLLQSRTTERGRAFLRFVTEP